MSSLILSSRVLSFGLLFLFASQLISCSTLDEEEDTIAGVTATYGGFFLVTDNYSVFRPCIQADERWEVSEVNDATYADSVLNSQLELPYVEFSGTPGEIGEFANFFIIYNRQFTLDSVLTIRPNNADNKECELDSVLF
ncbi:hypothetical protein AB2B38_011960 [Balneola sp. MJW-20]|uniref:hypothetical protein n=1 Tax=Gracilimonas aurantiaca TaxID=3234185 RepID=UPI003467D650